VADVQALRFDAGSLSLNLVATVGRRFGEPVERLSSVERLRAWLSGIGLEVTGRLTDWDVARVRRFREHVDELFRCALAGRRLPTDACAAVNTAVAASVPQLRATPGGVTLDSALALVAADAIRIVASRERIDLRICEADDCRMLYLGYGRRIRRWCSSEHCGNRSRVAAHRSRVAAAR
jgi:predicted RNA-binding Zn ribbon-like protein